MNNPSCIDLIITNNPNSFQNTSTFCTRLSDCHELDVTVLRTSFRKTVHKEIHYRDHVNFNSDDFKTELSQNLDTCSRSYENFEQTFLVLLDKHFPYKSKKKWTNQVPYMTKTMEKQS